MTGRRLLRSCIVSALARLHSFCLFPSDARTPLLIAYVIEAVIVIVSVARPYRPYPRPPGTGNSAQGHAISLLIYIAHSYRRFRIVHIDTRHAWGSDPQFRVKSGSSDPKRKIRPRRGVTIPNSFVGTS